MQKTRTWTYPVSKIAESCAKFLAGFDDLRAWLSLEINIQQLDMRHYGDAVNVRVILRQNDTTGEKEKTSGD
jgi:hypothetical protein